MKWFEKKIECIRNCTTSITPRILKKLLKRSAKVRKMVVYHAGDSHYKVRKKLGTYTLVLNRGTYDCKVWDMSRIPCAHACASIQMEHDNLKCFVHCYYNKEA